LHCFQADASDYKLLLSVISLLQKQSLKQVDNLLSKHHTQTAANNQR